MTPAEHPMLALVRRLLLPVTYGGDDTEKTNLANLERREAALAIEHLVAALWQIAEMDNASVEGLAEIADDALNP